MEAEKRTQAERDGCAIAASIRGEGLGGIVPCTITNLTEQGAGLLIAESTALPERFRLALPLTDEHLDERVVELRWRRGDAAGVRFIWS